MHRFHFHNDDFPEPLLVGRDVFIVAFFTERPYPEPLPQIERAFDHWLSVVPPKQLEWSLVGPNATTPKRFTPAAIAGCRRELDPVKAVGKKIGAFSLWGGDKFNSSHAFSFLGAVPGPKFTKHSVCVVEIRWPSEFAAAFGHDKFVQWVRQLGDLLPYGSGYASPALSLGWENMAHQQAGAAALLPIARRHPGYELPQNDSFESLVPHPASVGARWLTFLGPQLLGRLGGREALAARLDPRVIVQTAGDGVMLRAGEQPELGDTELGEATPLLRSVAAAIEPVTAFENWRGLETWFEDHAMQWVTQGRDERHEKMKADVLRWERRHLD